MKDTIYLPDYEGIANDMGDFFTPNDCRDGYVIRKGKIKKMNGSVVEMVMGAYCPSNKSMDLAVLTYENERWSLNMGTTSDRMKDILYPIIQTRDW